MRVQRAHPSAFPSRSIFSCELIQDCGNAEAPEYLSTMSMSPLLRLPGEIREMILIPLLVVDDLLHCPARVFRNRLISWNSVYAVQADMMFTCRLFYHEVMRIFLQENNFFFSAPPTTTLFPCARYARRVKSITFEVHHAYWEDWQTYLRANTPLVVKNLDIQIVHFATSADFSYLSLCECFIENVVVTEKVSVRLSSSQHINIRRKCLSFFPLAGQALISFADLQDCVQKAMLPRGKDKGPFLALTARVKSQLSSP